MTKVEIYKRLFSYFFKEDLKEYIIAEEGLNHEYFNAKVDVYYRMKYGMDSGRCYSVIRKLQLLYGESMSKFYSDLIDVAYEISMERYYSKLVNKELFNK